MHVGFLGLGTMGAPMALNLSRRFPLTIWNRSPSKYPLLTQAGARVGATPSEVARQSDVVFTMLFDAAAIDAVLDSGDFRTSLGGKTLVNMSSVPEAFSHHLDREVRRAGGRFVEMPVSGSKGPAEQGQLVGMLGGDAHVAEEMRHVVEPMTRAAVYCGPVGYGLRTKYAANLYLTTLTVGLAESMSLARAQGLDLAVLGEVLNAGPMASAYSRGKITKIIEQDWSPQAAAKDCYNSSKLICAAAEAAAVRSPLIQACRSMYAEATEAGLGEEDMIAVMKLLSRPQPNEAQDVDRSQDSADDTSPTS
jgi:3-hydroxyisobutyrate dehydrogenase-like beta-hydroxyacid dehydrogenase